MECRAFMLGKGGLAHFNRQAYIERGKPAQDQKAHHLHQAPLRFDVMLGLWPK